MPMDFFIADPEKVADPHSLEGPDYNKFTYISSRGVDCIAVSALDELVTGVSLRMPELVFEEGEGGRSVWHISPELQQALAELPPDEREIIIEQWADNEEWEMVLPAKNTTKFLASFLAKLCQLAEQGREEDKQLFLWIAL